MSDSIIYCRPYPVHNGGQTNILPQLWTIRSKRLSVLQILRTSLRPRGSTPETESENEGGNHDSRTRNFIAPSMGGLENPPSPSSAWRIVQFVSTLILLLIALLVGRTHTMNVAEALGYMGIPFLLSAIPSISYFRTRFQKNKETQERLWFVISIGTLVFTVLLSIPEWI